MELQKQQMITLTARVYAKYMTEAELQADRRLLQIAGRPEIRPDAAAVLDDIVAEIATWTQNLSEYVIIRARAEMEKRGHQLQ